MKVARRPPKSQFHISFWHSTTISREKVSRRPPKSQFHICFWHSTTISCDCERVLRAVLRSRNFTSTRPPFRAKGLRADVQNRNFTSVFDTRPPFRAKRLRADLQNRNVTSVLDTRPSFRAKRLRANLRNRNFTTYLDIKTYESEKSAANAMLSHKKNSILPQFSTVEPHFAVKIVILPQFLAVSCERVVAAHSKSQFHRSFGRSLVSCERGALKIAILLQFLAIEPHFVRKGCDRRFKIAISPKFLAIELRFVRKGCRRGCKIAISPQFLATQPRFVRKRKGCVSCRLVGTAPRLIGEKLKKGKRRWQESKRAREQEGKRARGQERMWRCEDVKMWGCEDVRMWGCEDEKMWRWEDVKMRCEDEKMWRWEDVKMWGCEDVRMWRCEDEKMWGWEDVRMRRCKVQRWEDLNMSRCEDERMWRCEDVKMWGCEDEKVWGFEDVMWRCEDVKMWKCLTGPTIRIRSNALGKNSCIIISTRTAFVMQERPAHTRTWNLKAALGTKPCKVNQKYQHTNVNQHVLAEEVPNNPNKNQVSSLKKSIAQSCPICSVTQYTKIS